MAAGRQVLAREGSEGLLEGEDPVDDGAELQVRDRPIHRVERPSGAYEDAQLVMLRPRTISPPAARRPMTCTYPPRLAERRLLGNVPAPPTRQTLRESKYGVGDVGLLER